MEDFVDFLRERNQPVADGNLGALHRLAQISSIDEIQSVALGSEDSDFERLSYEYLPLWFGRRHGYGFGGW